MVSRLALWQIKNTDVRGPRWKIGGSQGHCRLHCGLPGVTDVKLLVTVEYSKAPLPNLVNSETPSRLRLIDEEQILQKIIMKYISLHLQMEK